MLEKVGDELDPVSSSFYHSGCQIISDNLLSLEASRV